MRRRTWVGTVAIATTCALIGAAGGIASSGAATTAKGTSKAATAKTTTKATAGRVGGGRGFGGGGAVHSESVQLNKAGTAYITVTRDEGTVTAVSGSDITLHEGTTTVAYKDATVTVAAGATVTRNDATAALTDIKVGDRVSIEQSSDGAEVRAYDSTFVPTHMRGGPGHGFGHGGPPPGSDDDSSTGTTTSG